MLRWCWCPLALVDRARRGDPPVFAAGCSTWPSSTPACASSQTIGQLAGDRAGAARRRRGGRLGRLAQWQGGGPSTRGCPGEIARLAAEHGAARGAPRHVRARSSGSSCLPGAAGRRALSARAARRAPVGAPGRARRARLRLVRRARFRGARLDSAARDRVRRSRSSATSRTRCSAGARRRRSGCARRRASCSRAARARSACAWASRSRARRGARGPPAPGHRGAGAARTRSRASKGMLWRALVLWLLACLLAAIAPGLQPAVDALICRCTAARATLAFRVAPDQTR